MLHRLMEAGLARQIDPDRTFRPMIELTAAGVAVMKGTQLPPVTLIDLITPQRSAAPVARRERAEKRSVPDDPDEQLDPETSQRFSRLRTARLELARERQVPPYCICHDSTLKTIARLAPESAESLEQIKGMGPMKIKMYGEKLLAAVKGTDSAE